MNHTEAEAAKDKLRAIIADAKQRREALEAQPLTAPRVPAAQSAPEPEPAPQQPPQPVVEPEPTPESHPHLFIEERVAETRIFNEPNGDAVIQREVLTGRFLSSFRRRLPSDGDSQFVVLPPRSRLRPTDETINLG